MDLKHFSHEHVLKFIEYKSRASKEACCSGTNDDPADEKKSYASAAKEDDEARCFGCGEQLEGPSYCCDNNCKFYLHKSCAELELAPEINHPFHPSHPLNFLAKSPSEYMCDFCNGVYFGFVYHCALCDFDLDVKCALLQSSENFHKLEHFLHKHPLIFNEKYNKKKDAYCMGCGEELSSRPIYKCLDCCGNDSFFLHEECAELELALEINHPLHPSHPLYCLAKLPRDYGYRCNFCNGHYRGFVYHCALCNFNLDIECALFQLYENFDHKLKHSLHKHPLILTEKYDKDDYCMGCRKNLSSGPIYKCLDCLDTWRFHLHKECAELPPEINHPYHRKHPLTLLSARPDHPHKCSCSLCEEKDWFGFVYYCSICKFGLTLEEVLPPNLTIAMSHQHQWTLLPRLMPFTCDFCGMDGDFNPYLCTCSFVIHKDCKSLPHTIRITRHHHSISHIYSLQPNKIGSKECRICFHEVSEQYGCYSCSAPDCNYIAHAKCATNDDVWDGTAASEDEDSLDSTNLITVVIKEISEGEAVIATEINHAYHDHNLILTRTGEVKGDNTCDGCNRAISSTPFYSCQQCIFFLHKDCAELPRQIRSPLHKHVLTLFNGYSGGAFSRCSVCRQLHSGFIYLCTQSSCDFDIDIQCSLLSDTLKHPSHEHLLFLDHKDDFQDCSACSESSKVLYRCTKRCGFALDLRCITLPLTTWFKYDKHPLTLTFHNSSDPSQLYCDLCEDERHPDHCFYYCEDCDNTLHRDCVLGELPFVKPGSTVRIFNHSLTVVSKIWNCPPCKVCGKLCNRQAFECEKCKVAIHWGCRTMASPCI